MLNITTCILMIAGLGAIGGYFGGVGFAFTIMKFINKKLPEYIEKYKSE